MCIRDSYCIVELHNQSPPPPTLQHTTTSSCCGFGLPFSPENHLLPEKVSGRRTCKALVREKMFFSMMKNDELLQAKYLLARMVLNCPDSPALRCLCLCEPDCVLSDPDIFMDTVYDDHAYREPWR